MIFKFLANFKKLISKASMDSDPFLPFFVLNNRKNYKYLKKKNSSFEKKYFKH